MDQLRIEATEECVLAGFDKCSGRVMNSICEGHSWEIFQAAWR